jgi:putative transposase
MDAATATRRDASDHGYRLLIHDRNRTFSAQLDRPVRNLRLLKTPVWIPQANAICERLLGTLHREGLDCMIPLIENYLRRILIV